MTSPSPPASSPMALLPAIDLRGGLCVNLYQGDFAQETVYGDDPVALARRFADDGAPWVHMVDLDAARRAGDNRALVEAVAAGVDVPVQVGGGVRDASLLDAGVARVVLGSLAVDEPAAAAELIARHPGAVAIGIDHLDDEVRTRGWEASGGVALLDAVARPEYVGAAAFVVTAIARDGTLTGPDLDRLKAVIAEVDAPVIASGGIATLDDLRAVRDLGAAGAIVGKAIYEGAFTVAEGVAVCAR